MGMNEFYSMEVVLGKMDTEGVLFVKSPATPDYDPAVAAVEWINFIRTGRVRVVAMTPVNGQGAAAHEDATTKPEPTCPMDNCVMGPHHGGDHQDKAGETWDSVDVLANRLGRGHVEELVPGDRGQS